MLTKTRGNDRGNIIAMILGFLVVAILSGLPNNVAGIFGSHLYPQPSWLPVMEFPWWIFLRNAGHLRRRGAVQNQPATVGDQQDRRRRFLHGFALTVGVAEGVGFEPTVGLTPRSISSRVP